jgi:ABC-type multidrug transport system ATPase subunit
VNTVVQGEVRLNGSPYDNAELKRVSGYVMQDDLLSGYLTVEETLMYTAELRLPRTFTYKQRKERGYDYLNIGGCIGILIGYIIFCRTWAFIGVRFLKN